MKIELRTRIFTRKNGQSELVMEWHIVPRGGANRKFCQEMAEFVRNHPRLAEHIRTIKIWSSRFDVHFNPSFTLSKDLFMLVLEAQQAQRDKAEPTLPLPFASPA